MRLVIFSSIMAQTIVKLNDKGTAHHFLAARSWRTRATTQAPLETSNCPSPDRIEWPHLSKLYCMCGTITCYFGHRYCDSNQSKCYLYNVCNEIDGHTPIDWTQQEDFFCRCGEATCKIGNKFCEEDDSLCLADRLDYKKEHMKVQNIWEELD